MDTGLIEMPKPASALPEGQVTPEPSLEKRTRRRFTSDYKLRMIAEAVIKGTLPNGTYLMG